VILAPSVLAADLGRLAEEIAAAERGGAGLVHVDVMDGRFVPNISLGPAVARACRRATRLGVDVHLMVESPERHVDAFVDAGASSISVHVEAPGHLQRTVAHLRGRGVSPGVVLNPATPLAWLEEILPEVDFVLLMSVNPGFAGQAFLPASLGRIRRLRETIRSRDLSVRIQVDGGIDLGNIREVVEAGTDIVVVGTAVFGGGDPERAVRALAEAARPAASPEPPR
jgi:ribulose-phosphate 3-epimerase